MKIAITGAAGFLGSYLVDYFLEQGHDVIGIDNLLGGDWNNLKNPNDIVYNNTHKNRLSLVTWDCRSHASMVVALVNVDIVYHCAATAHEGLSVFSPSFITQNIFEASVSVISAAIANKVKRFVYMSSMARYGHGGKWSDTGEEIFDNPRFKEHDNPNPVDPYGIAKAASEQVLKALSEEHGMEYIVAVPHNIIGVRQNYTDPYRNVASIMMNRLKQGLKINIYGDGQQTRCFSPIEDCLDCLIKLSNIDYTIVKEKFGINHSINIGPDNLPIKVQTLANMIIAYCLLNDKYERPVNIDWKEKTEYLPARPLEVKHATCSSDLARKLLNYKEVKNLNDCLKEMWNAIPDGGVPFKYEYPVEIVNERTPKTWLIEDKE